MIRRNNRWGVAAVLALASCVNDEKSAQDLPPHVVMIVVDTLRADALGVQGARIELPGGELVSPTPTLDVLAESGVRFDDAEAASSWTLTSTVTFLSGKTPMEHGMRSKLFGELPETLRLLPDLLADAGYRTSAVVCNPMLGRDAAFDRRFEDFLHLRNAPAAVAVDSMVGGVDEALRAGEERPFFLYLHLLDPHWPYVPATEEVERFGLPPSPLSEDEQVELGQKLMQGDSGAAAALVEWSTEWATTAYRACAASADREIARYLSELERLGVLADALVVFTSDHGEEFGENGSIGHARQLFRESLHVPLVIAGAKAPVGAVVKAPVELRAIPATVFDAIGLERPDGLQGTSLLRSRPPEDASSRAICSYLHFGLDPVEKSPVGHLLGLRLDGERVICPASASGVLDLESAVVETFGGKGSAAAKMPLLAGNGSVSRPDLVERLEAHVERRIEAVERSPEENAANRARRKRELEQLGYFGAADEAVKPGGD